VDLSTSDTKDCIGDMEGFESFKYAVYSYRTSGAWLSERLRRWPNKPDVVGSIPVTTEFFLISCDFNQVPKWFGTHYNLKVPL